MARRVDDPTALITALESHHFSLWGLADPGERLALATEIVRLAEELNDRELLLTGHQFRITDLLEIGDIGAVDRGDRRLRAARRRAAASPPTGGG